MIIPPMEEVIPPMMTVKANMALTRLPSMEEVHNAVLSLDKDKDSARGPTVLMIFSFKNTVKL